MWAAWESSWSRRFFSCCRRCLASIYIWPSGWFTNWFSWAAEPKQEDFHDRKELQALEQVTIMKPSLTAMHLENLGQLRDEIHKITMIFLVNEALQPYFIHLKGFDQSSCIGDPHIPQWFVSYWSSWRSGNEQVSCTAVKLYSLWRDAMLWITGCQLCSNPLESTVDNLKCRAKSIHLVARLHGPVEV